MEIQAGRGMQCVLRILLLLQLAVLKISLHTLTAAHARRHKYFTDMTNFPFRLLQFPCKHHPSGHTTFNLLIDPWFDGAQIDFFPSFSKQWHAVESCVESIAELNTYLEDIELANKHRNPPESTKGVKSINPFIDAVLISHEFTDHCNEHTLRELDVGTPVFATTAAAKVIRAWGHFEKVREVRTFSETNLDWTRASPDLPPWLGMSRLVSTSFDIGYLHSAVMICFNLEHDEPESVKPAEAIIYTPHGIYANNLCLLSHAVPRIQPLALIHGLHEVTVCNFGQINLGATNALDILNRIGARYWISTHDVRELSKQLNIVFVSFAHNIPKSGMLKSDTAPFDFELIS